MGDRQFPIMGVRRLKIERSSIAWSAIAAHDKQARRNHGGQSLEDLAARGGLDPAEAWCVVHGVSWMEGAKRWSISEMNEGWAKFASAL